MISFIWFTLIHVELQTNSVQLELHHEELTSPAPSSSSSSPPPKPASPPASTCWSLYDPSSPPAARPYGASQTWNIKKDTINIQCDRITKVMTLYVLLFLCFSCCNQIILPKSLAYLHQQINFFPGQRNRLVTRWKIRGRRTISRRSLK